MNDEINLWEKKTKTFNFLIKLKTHLWNSNFFANEYNSKSKAFSSSTFRLCSMAKLFIVVVETVVLCCSNGIAKRKLNVSSKMYCEIYKYK